MAVPIGWQWRLQHRDTRSAWPSVGCHQPWHYQRQPDPALELRRRNQPAVDAGVSRHRPIQSWSTSPAAVAWTYPRPQRPTVSNCKSTIATAPPPNRSACPNSHNSLPGRQCLALAPFGGGLLRRELGADRSYRAAWLLVIVAFCRGRRRLRLHLAPRSYRRGCVSAPSGRRLLVAAAHSAARCPLPAASALLSSAILSARLAAPAWRGTLLRRWRGVL